MAGLLGIICGIFISGSILAASESFNVPFLSPIAPKNGDSIWGTLLIKPIWKKEHRPKNLQVQDPVKQPHISRKWLSHQQLIVFQNANIVEVL